MKTICLQNIACGGYIRVAEDCETRNNLGLIVERKLDGEFWLWVKKTPTASRTTLYPAKDRLSFKPYKNNRGSTPRGGTGYLGGRKFPSLGSVEAYLSKFGKVVWC